MNDCPMNSLVRVVYVAVPMYEAPLHAHRVHGLRTGKCDVGLHTQEFFNNLKANMIGTSKTELLQMASALEEIKK